MKENDYKNLYPVILAGGLGSRLWPLSRELFPKQFLKINNNKYSLFQETILRLEPFNVPNNITIVTNSSHLSDVEFELKKLKIKGLVLSEPFQKNTAPAVLYAAVTLIKINPEAVMLVLPSDHLIKNGQAFVDAVKKGFDALYSNCIVTFGIKPISPETGYGYIKGGSLAGDGIIKAERFVEKPDKITAEKYLENGNYYWNAGMFMFRASDIIEEFKEYLPEIYEKFSSSDLTDIDSIFEIYEDIPSISIDYGIMEKSGRVVIIPSDIGWQDVGNWEALYDLSDKNKDGNAINGNDIFTFSSKDNLIYSRKKKVIATIGVSDLIIIDTGDALLVCNKKNSQDVKKVVDELKKINSDVFKVHKTVTRPWGYYTVMDTGGGYKIKKIFISPKNKLSLQMHYHRSEHWVVVKGTAKVTSGDKVFLVNSNESTFIPKNTIHRLENPGKIPLEIIEVQNGEYLEEDDITRVEDEYGRKS